MKKGNELSLSGGLDLSDIESDYLAESRRYSQEFESDNESELENFWSQTGMKNDPAFDSDYSSDPEFNEDLEDEDDEVSDEDLDDDSDSEAPDINTWRPVPADEQQGVDLIRSKMG